MATKWLLDGDDRERDEASIVAEYLATANQEQSWRGVGLKQSARALNIAFKRRLEGHISDRAIDDALQSLVDRHEILRTLFRVGADGRLRQEVLGEVDFCAERVDLQHLPEEKREAELQRLGAAEARKLFAFTQNESVAPLFRVLLVRMASDLSYIHFTLHQLIADGWSMGLIEDEFGKLAAASQTRNSSGLAPVEMQFGDFASWQNDVLASSALEPERAYWQKKLADLPRFAVAPDRPGPRMDCEGEIRSILLPRELSSAFEALARRESHTLTSFATAAAAVALHLITGQNEVVLGMQTAGREEEGAEGIVGPIVNSVVLRLPIANDDSFLSFADRMRSVQFEAMQHQSLPFAEVENMMRGPESDRTAPVYSTNIAIQRTNISLAKIDDDDFGPFRMASEPSHSTGALWDLSMFMVGREEGWRISCEGASALYDGKTIEALLSVWRKVIEGILADPEARIDGLARLEAHELRRSTSAQPPKVISIEPARRNPRIDALRERVIPLQGKGDRVPVIAINNASFLYPVAREIGTDHPFYDIQFSPSSEPIEVPKRHFADYARDAVEMIRLAKPQGPYVLFGLCVNGAIAIEAARILQSEGEDVPLVVLNDTYRPGYREFMPWIDRKIRGWQIRKRDFLKMHSLWKSGALPLPLWLDNYRLIRKLKLTSLLAWLGMFELSEETDAMQVDNRWFIEGVLLPTLHDFEMTPYSGRVLLFRSAEWQAGRLFPPDFAWGDYVDGEFEVVDCPGAHDAMFRPEGAKVIGANIRKILDRLHL